MPPTFRSVLQDRSFAAISAAMLVSFTGDQLARVALSVLVYASTGSGLLTGLVYAVPFVAAVVGGPLLNGLADRRPRRQVMIACDLVRAVLVALMTLPHAPLVLLVLLIIAVSLAETPYLGARSALVADVLGDERFAIGTAVAQMIIQASTALGFLLGGALLLLLSPRGLLAVDAASYLFSALALRLAVGHGTTAPPRTGTEADQPLAGRFTTALADVRHARSVVLGDPEVRALVLVVWLTAAAAVAPEALAAPYAEHLHGGRPLVGVLLGASAIGSVGASLLVSRLAPARSPLLVPLAVLAVAPLLVCLLDPGRDLVLLALLLSGAGLSVNVLASARFVRLVPNESRGRAFGLVGTGLAAGQGLALAVAGGVSDLIGPSASVGVFGVLGTLGVAVLGQSVRRTRHADVTPKRVTKPGIV